MRSKCILSVLVLLTVLTFSCNQTGVSKPKDFDYGHVENNIYLNSFFDLQVKLPTEWVVQSKEQLEHIAELGKDLIAGDDKNMKAAIKASEINTANLLAVFKHEVGTAVEFNPNFILVAENIEKAPGIKNGADYLYQTRKVLKQSQIQYESIDEDFEKVVINDQEFYTMNSTIDYVGQQIHQKYYSTIQNGFCLSAIISYADEEQKNELEKIINTFEFSK